MTSPKSLSRSPSSAVSATTIVSSLLTVQTPGAGFTDLTAEIAKFVSDVGAREGAVTLFIRHTSASLTIQENADPAVLADLTTALDRLAPENAGWRHDTEGPDDMPAHVKTMLTATSLQIPVLKRRTRAGNVAGDLPDRASPPPASPRDRAAVCRGHLAHDPPKHALGPDRRCERFGAKITRHLNKTKPAADRSAAGLLRQSCPSGCRRPRNCQFVLISTSLVSGRKKKPTTAVIDAKMIGYQRPA